jgi:hypothetical protein
MNEAASTVDLLPTSRYDGALAASLPRRNTSPSRQGTPKTCSQDASELAFNAIRTRG